MYKPTLYLFGKYASISVLNTIVHWFIFFFLLYGVSLDQAWSNLIAYMFALTFSFHVNARFTFKARVNKRRYFSFVSFMAMLSFFMGTLADNIGMQPLMPIAFFSFISLFIGLSYSKLVVFIER